MILSTKILKKTIPFLLFCFIALLVYSIDAKLNLKLIEIGETTQGIVEIIPAEGLFKPESVIVKYTVEGVTYSIDGDTGFSDGDSCTVSYDKTKPEKAIAYKESADDMIADFSTISSGSWVFLILIAVYLIFVFPLAYAKAKSREDKTAHYIVNGNGEYSVNGDGDCYVDGDGNYYVNGVKIDGVHFRR